MKFPALPPPMLRHSISYNLGDYEVLPTSPETQNPTTTFEHVDVVPQSPEIVAALQQATLAYEAMPITPETPGRIGLGAAALGGEEVARGEHSRINVSPEEQIHRFGFGIGAHVKQLREDFTRAA